MILLSFSTVTVFSTEEVSARQVMELSFYIEEVSYLYGVYNNEGDVYIEYTDKTFSKLKDDINSASEMIENYYMGVPITQEMIDEAYEIIDTDANSLCVKKSELEFLIDFCNEETNVYNYYTDEAWDEFQSAINTASIVFSKSTDDTEITTVYWDLRASYNVLCVYNPVMGDINGDGIVSVLDATLLSKSLVEKVSLNSSQKVVSAITSDICDITVNDVTAIQKYLVSNSELNFRSAYLNEISDNIYSKDLTTNRVFYLAVFHRYFGG